MLSFILRVSVLSMVCSVGVLQYVNPQNFRPGKLKSCELGEDYLCLQTLAET